MKKYLSLFLCILLISSILCGCGASNSTQEEQSAEEATEKQSPETHYTDHQTEIANLIDRQGAYINNGWIYSNGVQNDNYGFYKRRTDNSDIALLHSEVDAQFITVNGEFIYAVLRDYDTNHSGVYRYRLGGDDEKELVANASTLQIIGDSMYYCKCEENDAYAYTKFCKSNLDGEKEEVIIDKPIYSPCLIDNTLFYQDDADNETLHKYNLETKEDTKITQEKTYAYTLDDENLYCVVNDHSTIDDDYDGTLIKVDLQTLESSTIYEGASTRGLNVKDNTLYFINTNDEDRLYCIGKDGSNIGIITQDSYVQNQLILGDSLYYADCDSESVLEGFVMCKLDGSDKFTL